MVEPQEFTVSKLSQTKRIQKMKINALYLTKNKSYFFNDYHNLPGASLHTGAQKSVISLPKDCKDCHYMGVKFKPENNNHKYNFGYDRPHNYVP